MARQFFLFAKVVHAEHLPLVKKITQLLKPHGSLHFYEKMLRYLPAEYKEQETYSTLEEATQEAIVITLGGDGTLLDAVVLAGRYEIPILGINLGRMGFLATVAIAEIEAALKGVIDKNYTTESRVMLKVSSEKNVFGDENFGLNELTIHKRDTSSMIKIHTYLDDVFLNSYWADGIIIATPTGSTAYSLSCGGPIVVPGSENFVITPVAPHNLNVRPIVIPDSVSIKLEVEGRADRFMASLDSRTATIDSTVQLTVEKHRIKLQLIKFKNEDYPSTIRKKLNWGLDIRN